MWYFGPALVLNLLGFLFLDRQEPVKGDVFNARLPYAGGVLRLDNIRRGVSIIGAAGSGKTESVIAQLLKHFFENDFSGVIHDYKDFELTEIVYPLVNPMTTDFYCVSFEPIHSRVNPIAPRYLPSAEAINEVVRVLLSNLLEQREEVHTGSGKFFSDAVEGLLAGLIWRLKTDYADICTLPHLIALYQQLDTKSLLKFVSGSPISKAMANAFIQGAESERQTAGVLSTLSNALKKLSTLRIFYVLSADDVPLDINQQERPTVLSIVNNPKYEAAYAPVIATIMHTVIKQMTVRHSAPSFVLMEEAPTIRLTNMHRIPATLRSFDIATIYVMQDKIQNDMMYGDKASKAILSNLSYQFFGKVNDPDTAKYYERFFEIVKKPTRSVNRSHTINFDTRETTGEKEVSKVRADVFFRLQPGEFISFADGKEKRLRFKRPNLVKKKPAKAENVDLERHFARIHAEVQAIFRR
ncbi:type IV secretory system conjugative DNA transfer family protein [Maribacter sp. 2307ULW6-5]|uniref:type IV secretory system conjugative DNA transfer family protein n=1 Tax=Maribacter sp. 2307ULW6-5 TaxID=3386275 RepID=UPI0039BD7802